MFPHSKSFMLHMCIVYACMYVCMNAIYVYQARSQGFELGGSDFGHTQNHTQCHTTYFFYDKRTDGGISDE